jgi:hypothetical protein
MPNVVRGWVEFLVMPVCSSHLPVSFDSIMYWLRYRPHPCLSYYYLLPPTTAHHIVTAVTLYS